MSIFSRLLGEQQASDNAVLQHAIERAVARVEPLLTQLGGYPANLRKPVDAALEYARTLAAGVPGPVEVSRESYAGDPLVHALFPSADSITEAMDASASLRDYFRRFPAAQEMYALMGMRRFEKVMLGVELSGQHIQRDVPQNVIYFTSHTLENPAPTEAQARELMAWGFFDKLMDRVAERIARRRQEMKSQMDERDRLTARLRLAGAEDKDALAQELAGILGKVQATASSLELRCYLDDFEAVLLEPERHLQLVQTPIVMDSMGIRRNGDGHGDAPRIVFNDLAGFDRRQWTVVVVHCANVQGASFAERLDKAYRRLSI